MFLRGTVSSAQSVGPRETQEDYLVHVPFVNKRNEHGHLLGVMDGHGGEDVAKYCSETIPVIFDHDATDGTQELRKITEQLVARTQFAGPGSTLSLAYINETLDIAATAVLGDSPIIIVDDTGAAYRSEEHNVRTNLVERGAAIMRGAFYNGEDGYIQVDEGGDGLQMSRALGDRTLSAILDRTPSLRSYRINSRSMVIIGSDGLIGPEHGDSSDQILLEILSAAKKGDAPGVLRWREEQDSLEDNTSVIIWKPRRWWNLFS